jgi:predicted phosphoribosyltransferase
MGAIASGGIRVINENVVANLGIPKRAVEEATAEQERELKRREQLYRGNAAPLDIAQKTVILIDDGIATGATFAAALEALKRRQPAHIVIAVPVASHSAHNRFAEQVDEMVVLTTPEDFFAVGQVYATFPAVPDDEVTRLMASALSRGCPEPQRPL